MNKSRKMRCVRHVTHMGEMRNACKILVGKPERKRQFRRSTRRRGDNIKMDLRETVRKCGLKASGSG
jgi:hypothetical protein